MSSRKIIRVNKISKRYLIPHHLNRADTLREAIMQAVTFKIRRSTMEIFWALRDVSFDVMRGDRVAIMGINGSGKSTLLKVLSRVTVPTLGTARIHGRVSTLLELGAGFHGDLTGRENIFLNATLLGAKRQEIKKNFDQIIEFSEVGHFIDLPIKRYSSGMRARLGFAIAFNIETEILIIDEVLAVGDFAFREKCIGRIRALCESGHTLLFVNHGNHLLKDLCNRGIVLDQGRAVMDGNIDEALEFYTSHFHYIPRNLWQGDMGNSFIRLNLLRLSQHHHTSPTKKSDSDHFRLNHPIFLTIEYELLQGAIDFTIGLELRNSSGIVSHTIYQGNLDHQGEPIVARGRHTIQVSLRILYPPNDEFTISPVISGSKDGAPLADAPMVLFSYKHDQHQPDYPKNVHTAIEWNWMNR